ncbi:MAG: aromatic amino acid lyase [SAR324 cluster bacterium]|nr:aromatic amino acid lyase [SAR324 cluster bacterium]
MILDGKTVSVESIAEMARNPEMKVEISPEIEARVKASRKLLNEFVDSGRVIYGVTTGVGGFVNWLVPPEYQERLQNNMLRSVASNVGPLLEDDFVRATMLARINSLGRGASAIAFENYEKYVAMYNAGILPCIPEKGSLGASGDLGPLAFVGMVGTGYWRAKYQGKIIPAADALKKAGIEPMRLGCKEGLALMNGTSAMVGVGSCLISDAKKLIKSNLLISALSIEALRGKVMPFHPAPHENKPHPGQIKAAAALFATLADSKMAVQDEEVEEWLKKIGTGKPQGLDQQIEDAYSIRATPQILGPVIDTTKFVEQTVEIELNSTNDNPLILVDYQEAFHNANFHGQYMANGMDQMSIVLTTLCNLSDRRTDRMLDPANSAGLPAFLCKEDPGMRLGLMGGQFSSTSIMAELRSLCVPLSIQTLPTTGDFQDHVSMGLIAARRTRDIMRNAYYILAFEVICACQGADQRSGPDDLSSSTRGVYEQVRELVPYLDYDMPFTDPIESVAEMIQSGALLNCLPEDTGGFDW